MTISLGTNLKIWLFVCAVKYGILQGTIRGSVALHSSDKMEYNLERSVEK